MKKELTPQFAAKKAKGLLGEFKEFISRGNVLDMAVGIIIGTAFTGIVNSLVNDIIMPSIGLLIGGINFKDLKVVITPATASAAEVAVNYGVFLQKVIDFLIIALVVFLMIKLIAVFRRKKKEEVKAPPKPSAEVLLLTEIRDLLKDQSTAEEPEETKEPQQSEKQETVV